MKNSTRYGIIEALELLSGSVLPIIFWVSLIFGFDTPYVAILTLISAVWHELGHCFAIALIGNGAGSMRGHASGFRIKRETRLSYAKEIGILLAGPGVNIALFLATLPFGNALGGYLKIFGALNLATGISNLIPIEGYDGYGALNELFSCYGKEELMRMLEAFSFCFSTVITFVALYFIERFGEGYWIFGLFFFTMLSKLFKFGKYDIFEE